MESEIAQTVDDWMARCAPALGVPVPTDLDTILDIASVCAHEVARPTAPLTTFLAGYAAAQGMSPEQARVIIEELARVDG